MESNCSERDHTESTLYGTDRETTFARVGKVGNSPPGHREKRALVHHHPPLRQLVL